MLRSFTYAARVGAASTDESVEERRPRELPRRATSRPSSAPASCPAARDDRAAAADLRAREGRLRAALRAWQPARLGIGSRWWDRAPTRASRDVTVADEVEQVVRRDHADPHHLLGAHADDGGKQVVVRAFRPDAERVARAARRRRAGRARAARTRPGSSRAGAGRAAAPLPSSRSRYPGRPAPSSSTTRTRSCRRSASSTSTSPARASTSSCTSSSARTCARSTASRAPLRGLGAERALGQRRRRLQRLGRPPAPDALARRLRDLGALPARRRRRRRATSSSCAAGRRAAAQGRPVRARDRASAADRVGRPHARARVGGRGVARARASSRIRWREPISIYEVHLGSWRRPARATARSPTASSPSSSAAYVARHGLHARRAAAGHGAPVRRLVGLPGDGLLRARRRASARPTTSAPSSTRCTSRASA